MSSSRKLYGAPGPRRHAARCAEALRALRDFLDRRLDSFGPLEDAVVADAAPVALGAVTRAYRDVGGPLNSHEEFRRQVCGWRGYA